jgi:hypothetical protein
MTFFESSRSTLLLEHDLFGKAASAFCANAALQVPIMFQRVDLKRSVRIQQK